MGREIKILGHPIEVADDYVHIDQLKFLRDNPRVYACTHGLPDFDDLLEEQQQEEIFKKLLQQPSVKNLAPDIKRHRGLIEPILIRRDTMEVIEGNSRLAVYRDLRQKEQTGEWDLIPCDIVSKLTAEQLAALLSQIHVKGKTQWSAYEKANFAFVRSQRDWTPSRIGELFGESETTIRTRIKVIEMMNDNQDNTLSHFSYYDVIVRNFDISKAIDDRSDLKSYLFDAIRNLGSDDDTADFTAQELRKKLPYVLKKPKILSKLVKGKLDLDDAYQNAKISKIEENIKKAKDLVEDVSQEEVDRLERSGFRALRGHVRKLSQQVKRISKVIEERSTREQI